MNFSVVFDIESWTRVAALIMAKAPCHGRVTFNLSQSRFYLKLSQRRVRQPLRVRSLRILATNETRIVDESARLGEYQVMALRLIQFLAIILTALALVPSGAHLAAMPNKMAMAQAAYFVAQQVYAGWAFFGIVLFGALAANLAHAIVLPKVGRSCGYALASFLFIAASLVIFFVWTFPTNQATNNWTVVPENWNELRSQCECSHAANAVVTFAALVCVVIAVLRQPSQAR